jgi:outer membrane lipoprotein carrier protein
MKEKTQSNRRLDGFQLLVTVCVAWVGLMTPPGLQTASATATGLPLDQFINKVQQSYHDVRAIRADFTQTYDAGGACRVESGTVLFARGGRMRWDYRAPEKKVFLSNKKEVLLYLPAEQQLNRSSVKQSEDYRVPFRLLLSRLDLKKVFSRFEDANNEFQHASEDRVIIAYPKNADKLGYKRVVMEFDPQMDIRRLLIFYTNNTVMKFKFNHIDRNPRLASAMFELTPPPGTQIINHE